MQLAQVLKPTIRLACGSSLLEVLNIQRVVLLRSVFDSLHFTDKPLFKTDNEV